MRCVRQQFGGGRGQNTDGDEAMESESDSQAEDPPMAQSAGSEDRPSSSPTGMVNLQDDLVTQLNAALARESYRDASIIQHLMMDLLDLSHQNGSATQNAAIVFLGCSISASLKCVTMPDFMATQMWLRCMSPI